MPGASLSKRTRAVRRLQNRVNVSKYSKYCLIPLLPSTHMSMLPSHLPRNLGAVVAPLARAFLASLRTLNHPYDQNCAYTATK